jgi:branched-chain amino acid transport system permease protein
MEAVVIQFTINVIALGGIYALTALGINMIYGLLKIIHIAHAAIFTLGAYVGLLLFIFTGDFIIALAAGLLSGLATGTILPKFYLPLLTRSPLVALLVSIGLYIALEDLYRLIAGPHILTYPIGVWSHIYNIGGATINFLQLAIIAIVIILFTFVALLVRTRIGLMWRAAQQDLEMALAFGVNPKTIIALNFILGSALAGVAGVLVGAYYNSVFPTMGYEVAYKSLAIVVLGGLGSLIGTVVAAFTIAASETLVGSFIGFLPRDSIAFIALIIILIVRPWGICGRR